MACKVIWTQTAAEDLRQIVEFIARDSPDAAAALACRIRDQIDSASHMPQSNRMVPEKGDPSIREAILKPYRIIYSTNDRLKSLYVLRIWHAARGLPDIHA